MLRLPNSFEGTIPCNRATVFPRATVPAAAQDQPWEADKCWKLKPTIEAKGLVWSLCAIGERNCTGVGGQMMVYGTGRYWSVKKFPAGATSLPCKSTFNPDTLTPTTPNNYNTCFVSGTSNPPAIVSRTFATIGEFDTPSGFISGKETSAWNSKTDFHTSSTTPTTILSSTFLRFGDENAGPNRTALFAIIPPGSYYCHHVDKHLFDPEGPWLSQNFKDIIRPGIGTPGAYICSQPRVTLTPILCAFEGVTPGTSESGPCQIPGNTATQVLYGASPTFWGAAIISTVACSKGSPWKYSAGGTGATVGATGGVDPNPGQDKICYYAAKGTPAPLTN
jgi:hypothetical protein